MAKLIIGQNDLATVNPDLASEWHPTKNGLLLPSQVGAGTKRKVWWKCHLGHEWEASVSSRNKGSGCPYCAGQRAISGVNDLSTVNPGLAAEWHPNKNGPLYPNQIMPKSSRKVWWLGKCGHEWEATISSRTTGSGCPYCSGHKLLSGYNDLATVDSDLATEWHSTRNGDLHADQVTAHCAKKVWWIGKCGHEWEATVANRKSGNGCPFCSGRKILKGFNDLATVNSKLAAEWHPTKNGDLSPTQITAGTSKKVWWMCSEGHEWEAAVSSRCGGIGCPCCNHSQTSYVEQCVFLAFQARLEDGSVLSRDRVAIGSELDVYVPEKLLAVEYGAWHWHRNRIDRDRKKADMCESRGIRLIEIYDAFPEDEVQPYGMECLTFRSPLSLTRNRKELHALLNLLLECADLPALSTDEFAKVSAQAHRHSRKKTPEDFIAELTAVTNTIEVLGEYRGRDCKIKVRCKTCGHEWSASAGNLLSGYGCPNCKAINHSLRSRKTHEQFVQELSLSNPSVEVIGRYITNKKKVLVRGKNCGHEWQANPTHLLNGSGCPVCAGRYQGVVVCLETGEEYENFSQAAKSVGLKGSAGVKDSCMNPNRTAGGYHWGLKEN